MIKYRHLLGLSFTHGSRDCYELARDFYRDNYGLNLTPYARPDNWWAHGLNLYLDNFQAEGFEALPVDLKKLRPGDALLISINSAVPNHAGIYVGDGKLIHHFYGRLSEEIGFSAAWRNPCAMLRHPVTAVEEKQPEVLDVRQYLPPILKEALNA